MKLTLLKNFFAAFLRTRHITRHFRRLTLLDTLTSTGVDRELTPALTRKLIDAAYCEPGMLLSQLDSHMDGLSDNQAATIRDRVGLNEVDHEKPLTW